MDLDMMTGRLGVIDVVGGDVVMASKMNISM